MKTHTYAIVFAFVLSALVPQVSLAAWWNPFSWGIFNRAAVETPASTKPVEVACTMDAKACPDGSYVGRVAPSCDFATCPTAKPTPVVQKPVTPKPPVATPAAKPSVAVPAKPAVSTPAVTAPATSAPAAAAKPVDVPAFELSSAFTPTGFRAPLSIKSGAMFLSVNAAQGSDSKALGLWYLDKVTWRIVSDTLRSGDFMVSVSAGNSRAEDTSNGFNEPHVTALTGHAASDAITFALNGSAPNHGTFNFVIEKVEGHMKDDASMKSYAFTGTPITGPQFKF